MKLKIVESKLPAHKDTVACLGWTGNNELFSCSDDQTILRWNSSGEKQPNTLPYMTDGSYITDIHWLPTTSSQGGSGGGAGSGLSNANVLTKSKVVGGVGGLVASGGGSGAGGGGSGAGADVYVVATSDGKFSLFGKGRLERTVEAHKGATLCIRWSWDGSALVTAGEDGAAKIWSRSGMLRSALVQTPNAMYSVAWGPDNDQILFPSGRNLAIKPLQPGTKQLTWKGHEGLILKVDWNPVNNLIVSGGEDKRYKVWDAFGRQLYSSGPHDHVITSVAWCPTGETFAVGSFNTVRICDKIGWSHALGKPNSGSVFNIAWTPDGTAFACAGGNGSVCFAHIVDRRLEWKHLEVTIVDDTKVIIKDVRADGHETKDFPERVIKISLGFSHLVVVTASQCFVYTEKNFNTPAIIELVNAGRVTTVLQSAGFFLLVDGVLGIQIYTYDGRIVSSPKYPGMRPDCLTTQTMSLSDDILAVKDRADDKTIHVFEVGNGKLISDIKHGLEVMEVALDQFGSPQGRELAFIDKNRDLYITPVIKPNLRKLGTMVETFAWNDEVSMLAALMDAKYTVWYYPTVVFVDNDIAPMTREFGKNAQIVNFHNSTCTLRRADGALVTATGMSPFPALLHKYVRNKKWDDALRLCRHAKTKELWACLAGMAVNGIELSLAEESYAAIGEVDKVQYMHYLKSIPSLEGRSAELALFRRQPKEAENILLQAGLTFRAIKMCLSMYNWERALDIAVKYKTHIDTVLFFREKYLRSLNRKETSQKFAQYSSVEVNQEAIIAKISQEEENERRRGK